MDKEILCTGSQHMYFLKWIMADELLGLYQPNGKSWGWSGGEIAVMNMGIRTKRICRVSPEAQCSRL